jgi:hypothetical protein
VANDSRETELTGILNISNAEYHSGPGISKSALDAWAKGPMHYWHRYVRQPRPAHEPTPAMLLGTAVHAAVLEPDEFTKGFAVLPDINRRTNAGKEEYAAWVHCHPGVTVLTEDQMGVALAIRDRVRAHGRVASLFKKTGRAEVTFRARDKLTDALIKARTDWIDWDNGYILDVKTTEDASPEGFIKSVLKFRYHVQEPWYRSVIAQALGLAAPARWIFLAIEKQPPHVMGVYTLPGPLVAAGMRLARMNLQGILQATMLDEWPDPAISLQPIELQVPGWMAKQLDTPEAAFEQDED